MHITKKKQYAEALKVITVVMNASLQTTGIIQVIVWFGIFFLSLPLNLSWFCDASSYFSFVLRLSWRSCWPFMYWLSCDFHFLSLHHEMLVTGPSPPPNVQGDPVILVSLFSFFPSFLNFRGTSVISFIDPIQIYILP